MAEGFNVFVLDYSVGDFTFPFPLIEAYAAISYIRNHADKYNVDPNYIGVLGFSAGGHLAASISNYFKDEYYSNLLNEPNENIKIDFTILSYPVTTMDNKLTHQTTKFKITQNDTKLIEYFDLINNINGYFPPTFIWTTIEDDIVSYQNSLLMKKALEDKNIKNNLVLYNHGHHGGATCDELTNSKEDAESFGNAKKWIKEASIFIRSL